MISSHFFFENKSSAFWNILRDINGFSATINKIEHSNAMNAEMIRH